MPEPFDVVQTFIAIGESGELVLSLLTTAGDNLTILLAGIGVDYQS